MVKERTVHLFIVVLLLIAYVPPASAQRPSFEQWLAVLQKEALASGISRATLDSAFDGIKPIERVIELDRRQPEFTQTFWTYLSKQVTPTRVARGRDMERKHQALLVETQRKYGVPARYLVAFWGMETNFGRFLGSFPVVGSLTTLAYDERRSDFFRKQLLDALRILEEGHISTKKMKGSWAGAMGHLQFIPSTFINYAVDATGDGRRDVWNSLEDAFASGANYLNEVGWREREIWGREVRLPPAFDWTLTGLDTKKSVTQWAKLGVTRADGRPLPVADILGAIILPQGYQGPAFLVYSNFEVILRWNRSIKYAIAVGHLADRVIGLPQLVTGQDVDNRPLSRDNALEMQRLLNAQGFDVGEPDGIPGSKTKQAIRAFQATAGMPQDGYPSVSMLEILRESQGGKPK